MRNVFAVIVATIIGGIGLGVFVACARILFACFKSIIQMIIVAWKTRYEPAGGNFSIAGGSRTPNYFPLEDASGRRIGWYDVNSGVAVNKTKTAIIAPSYGSHDNKKEKSS